ncbi:hypothetical protein ES319_D04G008600v1 [Gossypium barbadense]|uniref:Uncharacterized protein n=1 Tax=Gossypium barbadense TaxID=3634 RepID=A0A5J5RQC2_GOSBA|nr:hypothetical protein ES319_D04G008600v1 [Gossypium barbadense]
MTPKSIGAQIQRNSGEAPAWQHQESRGLHQTKERSKKKKVCKNSDLTNSLKDKWRKMGEPIEHQDTAFHRRLETGKRRERYELELLCRKQ